MKRMINKLLCKIFGHQLYVYAKPKEKWATGIRWLKCARCGEDFTVNDRVKAYLPMNFELYDMNEWVRVKDGKEAKFE